MVSSDEEVIINGSSKAKFYKVKDTEFHLSSNYVKLQSIGEGAFGVVCSALNTSTNERVAIKKISFQDHPRMALKTLREVEILRHLRKYKAIVELKAIMIPSLPFMNKKKKTRDFNDIYLVFELMEGNLKEKIDSAREFTDKDYQHILRQLLLGLRHIHLSNIIHRDMKPENVLVDESLNLKICDFGLSRAMRTSRTAEPEEEGDAKKKKKITNGVGTPGFRAPELILGSETYDHAVDIWSVGCIFAELVNKKPLFHVENKLDKHGQLKVIMSKLGTTASFMGGDTKKQLHLIIDSSQGVGLNCYEYSAKENSVVQPASDVVVPFSANFPNLDPVAIELLERMLVLEPSKRITVEEALKHGYIRRKVEEMKVEFGFDDPIKELIKNKEEKSIDKIRKLLWDQMQSFHGDHIPNYEDDDDLISIRESNCNYL